MKSKQGVAPVGRAVHAKARIVGTNGLWSRLRRILGRLKWPVRHRPEPEDPYAYRTAPVRHPPRGRSGAAVAQLDEE
jgi:hypothetical protein